MHSGPIHERTITVKTFEQEDETLLVEGTLVDDRLCKSYTYLRSALWDPRTIHNITAKMCISIPDLIIKFVNTDMHEVPHQACRDIIHIGDKFIGVSLVRGFNDKIRQVLGGKSGCIHLYNLLISMRSAAFQGFYSYCFRVLEDGSFRKVDVDDSLIVNSCHVWRESGPFAQRLKEMKAAKRGRMKE